MPHRCNDRLSGYNTVHSHEPSLINSEIAYGFASIPGDLRDTLRMLRLGDRR